MAGMKYSLIEFFPPYLPDFLQTLMLLNSACMAFLCKAVTQYSALLFTAADDPTDHVSSLRLGSVQQRHYCDLLVRNTVQGIPHFSHWAAHCVPAG